MKWSGRVDDRTKEKIELLYKEFNKFIEENHSSNNAEDAAVVKQWANFKQVIEKNPTDFEGMHQYITKLAEEEEKEGPGTRQNRTGKNLTYTSSSKAIGQERKPEVSKLRLKKASNDFLNAINKNNRELFKV